MEHASRNRCTLLPWLLAGLLPLAAHATDAPKGGIGHEIGTELAEARKEVRQELAAARAQLETENLEVGNSFRFGTSGGRDSGKDETLPKAEITPAGDFLIEGRAVAVDAAQRRELLVYRRQVIDIASAGIEIGERSAQAALDAVDRGLFGLMFGALTGSLERRLERTIKQSIEPGLARICNSLPALHASQQRLDALLPQFRPYATLEADDGDDCRDEMRREFAGNQEK